jgi:hypothetical protein
VVLAAVIIQNSPEQYLHTYEDAARNQHLHTTLSPFALPLLQLIIE